ncbi:membrane hypothetical protein [Gammaproteobacteria bacterium]
MFRLIGIGKRFLCDHGHEVLTEVDLSIEPGNCYLLTGANGTGKSTLLRIAAGLLHADAGRIIWEDDSVKGKRNTPDPRRRIGYQGSEGRSLNWRLTVGEELRFWSTASGLIDDERTKAIAKVMIAFGLVGLEHHYVGRLSTGQAQRLILARAWLHRPWLLLLDEPLHGLDTEGQKLLVDALRSHLAQKGAVIIATHDTHPFAALSFHTWQLAEGRLASIRNGVNFATDSDSHTNFPLRMDELKKETSDRFPTISINRAVRCYYLATLRKDFLQGLGYRLASMLSLATVVVTVVLFYYWARFIDPQLSLKQNTAFGGNGYFGWALIGVTLSNYLQASLTIFGNRIRELQVNGTLEALFLLPIGRLTLIGGLGLLPFLGSLGRVGLSLLVGWLAFDFRPSLVGLLLALPILLLVAFCTAGIGLISAAFVLEFKKGDPIAWIMSALTWMMSGVYFPREVLPPFMRFAGDLLPMTPAIEALRSTLLGVGIPTEALLHLCMLSALTLPIGYLAWRWAVIRALYSGGLREY